MAINYLYNTIPADTPIVTPAITPQNAGDWLLMCSSYFEATTSGNWQNMDVEAVAGILQQVAPNTDPVSYTSPTLYVAGSTSNLIFDFLTNGSTPVQTGSVSFGGGGIGTGGSELFPDTLAAGDAILAVFQNNTFFSPSGNMTFSDTQGNTYFHFATAYGSEPYSQIDVFIAFAVEAAAPNTVTLTWASEFELGDGQGIAYAVTNLLPVPPTVFIQAVPSVITLGQSSTLNWVVMGASSQSIDEGIGAVPATGSRLVTPDVTTFYHLTAVTGFSPDQVSVTAYAEVEVLSNEAAFSLQKVILTLKQDRIPVRGKNG
jgi:hypothetical protein